MNGWRQFYYCTNCRRPYCKWEIRTGDLALASASSSPPSLHCVDCNESVCQPSPFIVQVISLLFFFVPMVLALLGAGKWEAFSAIPLLSGIAGLFVFLSSLAWSQKYEVIYDHWVMQFGTDPDKWPSASNPEWTPAFGDSEAGFQNHQKILCGYMNITPGALRGYASVFGSFNTSVFERW